MFEKVLIANRGEIALRVIRTCRELGLRTVAVHSEIDADALHTRLADEAICIGPADPRRSYLHIPAIIAAAEITGAEAVHPGYGFLSENSEFAETCAQCGLEFIGPLPEQMRLWGDKVSARALAKSLGLPTLEGTDIIKDIEDAVRKAEALGFPVLLKASGGGGGRGMHVLQSKEGLRSVFETARAESRAAFGNDSLYFEKYLERPRHIEFQILGDTHGNIHVLGERECSIQRRHQKIIEEAPSVALTEEMRSDMSATIRRAMGEVGYLSAGTLEFLLDERGELTFLEMNPRIQVEHPVTELVMGIDLIHEQIRIADGQPLALPSQSLTPRGHAIECRINAEDPDTFAPSPGVITELHMAGGTGVRVDSGIFGGGRVPAHYDPLVAKLIVHAPTRAQAIAKMRRALGETIIGGIRTNIPLHQRVLEHPAFEEGRISTKFLEELPT
ncbi:MAG: acetyl-CoA carboxylase biotin carboxylase subunit [Myxococcales bacterium]|nr:acetyl-CoA carboxylase biotin carboxylase subunit [Deltaproteobacteria bacterium]NND29035.1 acetyl-CoA carboxylase biotin carboxylase subunit [Myxococcales bacterium]MBT8480072.1 acetyl-CoA carboxylase biotin carboxylase subunit [Deltaproteobacteria bacterium]NNK43464.1 acetyl-CoA carboxylase biotin carboxylase subunit [Myxococcales bacterium]NNL22939.1 acetyl-CoA carboxylase biotin carboxylase subunit [Myxococcales bacterium]